TGRRSEAAIAASPRGTSRPRPARRPAPVARAGRPRTPGRTRPWPERPAHRFSSWILPSHYAAGAEVGFTPSADTASRVRQLATPRRGEGERMKRHRAAVLAALLAAGQVMPASASSHREAPLISQDPTADNTDVYA